MTMPFEASRSYVYRATRYELIPQIQKLAEDFGDVPFQLRDIWRPLLAKMYNYLVDGPPGVIASKGGSLRLPRVGTSEISETWPTPAEAVPAASLGPPSRCAMV